MRAALGEEPAGHMLRSGKQAWSADQLKRYATHVAQQKTAIASEMDQLLGAFQAVTLAEAPRAAAAAQPIDPLAALEQAMAGLGLGQRGGKRKSRRHHRKSQKSRKAQRKSRRHQ